MNTLAALRRIPMTARGPHGRFHRVEWAFVTFPDRPQAQRFQALAGDRVVCTLALGPALFWLEHCQLTGARLLPW